MRDLEIQKLEYIEKYLIKLYLSNGHQVIYDMSAKLKTARFSDIADSNVFISGRVIQNKIIRWNGNIEISLAEILMQITASSEEKWQKIFLKKQNEEWKG